MSKPTIAQIIAETEKLRKQAEAKFAELTGEDPASMPGSENDKPAPAEATNPDPQVADGTMGPDSARTTEGAGDDRPITAGSLFEADEPVLEPEKKPEDSADANAKTASATDIANDILSLIHGVQVSKQAEMAQTEDKTPDSAETKKVEADEPVTDVKKKPAESSDAETKEAKCSKCGSSCKNGKCSKCGADEKCAEHIDLKLDTEVMAKIAALMLATDEGADLAEKVISKHAGARAAEETLGFLAKQAQLAEEMAASPAEAPAEVPAEAPAEVPAEAPAEVPAEAPAEGEPEYTEEDVANAITQLVESGELSEDDLNQIISNLENQAVEEAGATEAAPEEAPAPVAPEAAPEKVAEAIRATLQKKASLAKSAGAKYAEELIYSLAKQAEEAGAADAEAVLNSADAEDFTADDVVEAVNELVDNGEISKADGDSVIESVMGSEAPANEPDVSEEELAGAIQEMLDSGELSEEEVQSLITELAGEADPEAIDALKNDVGE